MQPPLVTRFPRRSYWAVVATFVVLPTVHIGGYKKLAVMSALGVLCLSAIFILGTYYSIDKIKTDGAAAMPTLGEEESALWSLPAAFSMFVFAFSAHGIFPDLEASMENPASFGSVVSVVFVLNILVKVTFALAGVLAFGTDTDEILTTNLPSAPRLAVSCLIVANTLLSFPLPLVPVFRMLKKRSDDCDDDYSSSVQAIQRTLVVLFCGLVAASLPSFSLAMGFMGSLTLPFLTFIFPALFYFKLHVNGEDNSSSLLKIVLIIVVVVGFLCLVSGLVSNAAIASGWDE